MPCGADETTTGPNWTTGAGANDRGLGRSAGSGDTTWTWPTAHRASLYGTRLLFIGDVHHKATVIVDEEGTEAAAATGVGMETGAGPPEPPIVMRVDHPFIFLIRDTRTGTVLFVGRIVNPQS